ncbi:retrovirus-related pol polyprotein from transposon TNT 1-94 [Tanacetum coccineum]
MLSVTTAKGRVIFPSNVLCPREKRDETWFNDKVLLVQAQASGHIFNEEEISIFGTRFGPSSPKNELRKLKGKALDKEAIETHSVDPKVAFSSTPCFISHLERCWFMRDLEGILFITLYTWEFDGVLSTICLCQTQASKKPSLGLWASSSILLEICLLSKASKTKSWLWHHRLSHLNFGATNHLARHGLVRGIPKLKFEKDHLCSACALGKSSKKPHKPKSKDTNQEKLYLLHMDLYGPMRVVNVNGKKYILIIVDDYSQFTWVKCLRLKDEAPAFIINFLKMI